jgi:hypothetical protein
MGGNSGLQPDHEPDLGEFLLARIAEDKRMATDAATLTGQGDWQRDDVPTPGTPQQPGIAEHVARHDPAHVLAACAAKRRMVQVCREMGPDMAFLGSRPRGMADFLLSPTNQHQLAALTLALLAVPYADHTDYRPAWRP